MSRYVGICTPAFHGAVGGSVLIRVGSGRGLLWCGAVFEGLRSSEGQS